MKRILLSAAIVIAAGAFIVFATGASNSTRPSLGLSRPPAMRATVVLPDDSGP